jgi:hypothetical protein
MNRKRALKRAKRVFGGDFPFTRKIQAGHLPDGRCCITRTIMKSQRWFMSRQVETWAAKTWEGVLGQIGACTATSRRAVPGPGTSKLWTPPTKKIIVPTLAVRKA